MAKQVLKNIRLSDIQKEVLAKTIAAPNEDVAADEILDGGRNYVGAKNILVRLGLLTFHDNEAAITETGRQVMQKANLIDQTGQLTDEGQQYAYDQDDQQQQGQQDQQQGQQQGQGWGDNQQQQGVVDQGPLAGVGPSFGESFSLIRSVHEQYQFNKQLKRFSENQTRDVDFYVEKMEEIIKRNPKDPNLFNQYAPGDYLPYRLGTQYSGGSNLRQAYEQIKDKYPQLAKQGLEKAKNKKGAKDYTTTVKSHPYMYDNV